MNRPKNNNVDLKINSDSACIQGNQAILKRLQGHTNVQILNPIRNGEGIFNVLYFLVRSYIKPLLHISGLHLTCYNCSLPHVLYIVIKS